MNTKRFMTAFACIITFWISGSAMAGGGGSEVGGGGQVVDVGGNPRLRDLVDRSNCDWVTGSQFESENAPYFSVILKSLQSVHWYLSLTLENEKRELIICRTGGDLIPVPAEDRDSTTSSGIEGRQIAVRIGNVVLINMPLFTAAPPKDRGYVLLHETMHSLIPMNASQRNNKLRSFIGAIARNEETPMTVDDFALQLRMNQVQIVPKTVDFESDRAGLEAGLDQSLALDERAIVLQTKTFLEKSSVLRPVDQKVLQSLSNKIDEQFLYAIKTGRVAEITRYAAVVPNLNSRMPLKTAIEAHQLDSIKTLLSFSTISDRNPFITREGKGPYRAFSKAVLDQDLELVRIYLADGHDNKIYDYTAKDGSVDIHGFWNPVALAVLTGNLELVKMLVESGKFGLLDKVYDDSTVPELEGELADEIADGLGKSEIASYLKKAEKAYRARYHK